MQLTHNTEANQHRGSIRFRIPAVQLGKFTFKLAGAQAVCFRKVALRVQGILLLHDLIKAGVSHNYRFQH
ncbi:hypothetical protein D3C73_1503450 [compost metagenome]